MGTGRFKACPVPIQPPSPALVDRFRSDLEGLVGAAPGTLGLAVSGGPDSLALMLLANAAFPGGVEAATVDHGLRPESAAEAAFVGRTCAALSVPHAILAADAPIEGNVQAAARDMRYRLLAEWAASRHISLLLTAHHADDQAETLLMRLSRGAGLSGLSAIRVAARIAGLAIARPLLGWRRTELAHIVAEAGLEAVADPSNADEGFDRVRLRKRLAETPWIDPIPFARSAGALAEAEAALDWAASRLLAERLRSEQGATSFDPADVPAELRRRILLRILAPAPPPRGAELTRLIAALEAGATVTLAGVKCSGGPLWRFEPEPPRRA